MECKGIYLLDGDTLMICVSNWGTIHAPPDKDARSERSGRKDDDDGDSSDHSRRPVAFESSKSNEHALFIFKRDRSPPPR